jgi:hypothetical protein
VIVHMSSLYDLLNKIHQKPGVYIGAPSVSGLHLFLCGYAFSRQKQGLAITPEEQTFEQFQPWMQQRFNIVASVSWAKIILLHSADERAGFELFFELWAEFVSQQRQITTNEYERVVA